ncbi:hypothetical protein RHMOL_Rhmol01G0151900 [Rhododendron molle]|uniref:Uncharacterized protein n=1 Tax=Rhododendron molle TaxID=49168 RepID=A0ACC0Q326_RHOML|nr:hypothetical protein RHMOL_Rhmol01G0151900 [Rhododendron molle]
MFLCLMYCSTSTILSHLCISNRMGSSQNLPSNGQEAVLSTDPKRKKRKNRCSTLNFADNVDEDAQLSPDPGSNIRRGRGSTFLPDVIKDRSSGVRKVVKYNKRGQAIGETRAKYSSYFGVLARTMVPIDRTWKKVSDENKEMLWRCVKTTFDVDQRSRKNVLSAIAANCRTFRKALTRYIRAYKSDPDTISRPPAIYSFIEREHWNAFVKHRLTKDFKIKMIKKSIDGAEDKVAEGEDVDDVDEIDRSILWKKSRQNKNGEYDNEDIEEQAAMIDEFTKQAQEGNLDLGGSTDILALALCKHERSRVRGIEDFVTPTAYFQMPRRGGHSHCQEKIKALQTAMSQMKDQFHAMSQQVPHSQQSEYGASKNLAMDGNKGAPETRAWDANQATSSNVDSDKYLESLRSFEDYVETVAYKEAFTIALDEDMFGANVEVPLQRVDMEYMSQMKDLSVTCIMLYMRLEDPLIESHYFFIIMTFYNKLIFLPLFHWVLFAIDLSYPTVYYLDSLHGATNPNLKLIIKTAVKIRNNAKNMRRMVDWKEVEARCLKKHLKRLNAPKHWMLDKLGGAFVS